MVKLDKKLAELAKLAGNGRVQFQETEDGYVVTAVNGRSGARVTSGSQLYTGAFLNKPVLLRDDQFKDAVKAGETAEVREATTAVMANGATFTLEHQTGHFPDFSAVLPEHQVKVRVNAKLLAELLTIAAKFADKHGHYAVTLSLNGDRPIRVSCGGFDGCVVPLS